MCRSIAVVKPGELPFIKDIARWGLSFVAATLTLNVICTLLIASRIWYITRNVNSIRLGKSDIWTVAIIASPSLQTVSHFLFTYLFNS